jgi:hypothetical protein
VCVRVCERINGMERSCLWSLCVYVCQSIKSPFTHHMSLDPAPPFRFPSTHRSQHTHRLPLSFGPNNHDTSSHTTHTHTHTHQHTNILHKQLILVFRVNQRWGLSDFMFALGDIAVDSMVEGLHQMPLSIMCVTFILSVCGGVRRVLYQYATHHHVC